MRELFRTADRVRLSYVQTLLAEAGIDCLVLDQMTSNLFGGAIMARVVVDDADYFMASRVLTNARPASDNV